MGDIDAPEPVRPRVCVLLLQLGGPETLADIEPFLQNLLADVLPAPKILRKPLARMVARRRAPKVAPNYQEIGGGSPLRKNTEAQRTALEAKLKEIGMEARVLVCMRYAPPRLHEVIEEARRDWNDACWVALPLYPQYSFATTRSSFEELQEVLTQAELARLAHVTAYPATGAYIHSMVECVLAGLANFPEPQRNTVHLVFSAHGLPLKLVREGDPYPEHVQQTIAGILDSLGKHGRWPHHVCYQSRVGPVKWLEPSTQDKVQELGKLGVKNLLVVPVSFVSEHIETLHELDIELFKTAQEAGIKHYERAPTPGVRPSFIEALAEQVVAAVPKPRPLGGEKSGARSR